MALKVIDNPFAKRRKKTAEVTRDMIAKRWEAFVSRSIDLTPKRLHVTDSSDRSLREYRQYRKIRNDMTYHSRKMNRA